MKVNVIDLSSIIKISQYEYDPKDVLMKATIFLTKECYDPSANLLQLELYRLLDRDIFKEANANIFLLGNHVTGGVRRLENNLSKSEVRKAIKELDIKEKGYKRVLHIQEDGIDRNNLNVLELYCNEDKLKMIETLINKLKLTNPVVTEYGHYRYLPVSSYAIVSIEHSYVKIVKVENNEIVGIDTSIAGISAFLATLPKKSKAKNMFDMNIASIQSESYLQPTLNSMRNSIHKETENSPIIYVTGGGSNSNFLNEGRFKNVTPLKFKVEEMLTETYPEPLYNYFNSSILAAHAYANEYTIPDIRNKKYLSDGIISIPDKVCTLSKVAIAVSLSSLIVSNSLVWANRNLHEQGLYTSNKDLSLHYLSKVLPPNSNEITVQSLDKDGNSNNVSKNIDKLNEELTRADERISRLLQELSPENEDGKTLSNIITNVDIKTSSECYEIVRDTMSSLTYKFRGNIEDISKVEKILKEHYTNINYEVERIDDFEKFSIAVYYFKVYE